MRLLSLVSFVFAAHIIMYQFTSILYLFVLCISCVKSGLLPAILSPPSSSALSTFETYEANASAPQPSLSAMLSPPLPSVSAPLAAPSSSHSDRRETGLTTYDQKQSGKYNIHLNIKDVAIIALDAGGVDSGLGDSGQDYYEDYDLSDFTIKPAFGLVEISSNKPSTNATEKPSLINFEPDNWMANVASGNKTENAASNSTIEEPILKDPVNEPVKKPQSLEILNENASEQANGSTTIASIVSSTAKPAIGNSSPSSISHKQTPLPIQFPNKPNEIPVQIILESFPAQKSQSGRHRLNGATNANWHLRNRATPSHIRRITPPHSGFEDSPQFAAHASSALGNNKYRKHSLSHAQRRNCIVDQNGQCQNSQRRFGSPTL